jgi:hypothetical protein
MTSTTTGVFFIGKDCPGRPAVSEHKSDAGEFVLKMRLIYNQGPRAVEVYLTRWIGRATADWCTRHPYLKAGDALRLVLINPRSMPSAVPPETHTARAPTTAQAAEHARHQSKTQNMPFPITPLAAIEHAALTARLLFCRYFCRYLFDGEIQNSIFHWHPARHSIPSGRPI